jgi:uncharacterized membrane protein
VWNLILAYVPFGLGKLMLSKKHKNNILIFLFMTWLLFLPNAAYIITDFIHVNKGMLIPIWYDIILVFSFAFNGLLVFFLTVQDVHKLLSKQFSSFKTWIITILILFLTGFGVYLGRFLRFNSWEMASNPKILLIEIIDRITQPTSHPRTWGFTLGFGTLLLFGFLIFRTLNSKETIVK